MNARSRPRGFTLMHMMVAIPLLATFLYIGSRLFLSNNQLFLEADNAEQRLIHTDHALNMLRTDVWMSQSMLLDDQQLTLQQAEMKVVWHIDPNGTLSRASQDETQEHAFKDIGATRFAIRHQAVAVELTGESYLCPTGSQARQDEQGGKP